MNATKAICKLTSRKAAGSSGMSLKCYSKPFREAGTADVHAFVDTDWQDSFIIHLFSGQRVHSELRQVHGLVPD